VGVLSAGVDRINGYILVKVYTTALNINGESDTGLCVCVCGWVGEFCLFVCLFVCL
jgi:hypothetical protein